MKSVLSKLTIILLLFASIVMNAQQENNFFQISPRVGYDFPTFNNNTPYIDYKGGLEAGISLDYYWRKWGIGADFDYIKNRPESTYPIDDLVPKVSSYDLSEGKITRMFYGIGPSYRHVSASGKNAFEFNVRAGLGSVKGGRTLLTDSPPTTLYNFHAGYDAKSLFSTKLQAKYNFFFNESFGMHLGVYYLKHFNATELNESGISAGYHPIITDGDVTMLDQQGPLLREEPCDCGISSVGVFAGLTFKLVKKAACPVCGKNHTPHCCATCGCDLTVTAKDKFTNEILPNTDVVLTNLNGDVIKSGTTNSYGTVVFNDVNPDSYTVKGKLYNVNLDETAVAKSDFKDCEKNKTTVQKTIYYSDQNFILKGNVVECNSSTGIEGVDVTLKDKVKAGQKNTLSDNNGDFIFHLKQASTYSLKGNKDGYFSNEVEVSTNAYNRDTTLFIDFEMCVDPCGKAIRLDNINFDLDKWDILPQSIPDLQRVVRIMNENPTIKVEMSSHTDSRGSNAYNQDLSQKRAQSTVNYLVSQGIAVNRLIARGAGETELLNRCADNVNCSEAEHRINRRTEFKIVCVK